MPQEQVAPKAVGLFFLMRFKKKNLFCCSNHVCTAGKLSWGFRRMSLTSDTQTARGALFFSVANYCSKGKASPKVKGSQGPLLINVTHYFYSKCLTRGAWVAPSVKRPTSAQVTISRSVSSSPASGSVLTAQSPEPVSDSVSPSL